MATKCSAATASSVLSAVRETCGWHSSRTLLCREAGLPERGWHALRHSFGTHAAMFGANPWKLMQWMGHKRVDETMRYVHFAEVHLRPLPDHIIEVRKSHEDPDAKIIAMLGSRLACGKKMAKPQRHLSKPLGSCAFK